MATTLVGGHCVSSTVALNKIERFLYHIRILCEITIILQLVDMYECIIMNYLISFSNSAWRELSNDTPLGKIQAFLNYGLNHLNDLDLDDDIVEVIVIGAEVAEVVEAEK